MVPQLTKTTKDKETPVYPLNTFVQRYALVLFFLLSFVFFWGLLPLAAVSPALPPAIGAFMPALAAILVSAIVEGRAGVKSLLLRLSPWRVGLRWYAVALFLPAVINLTVLGLAILLGSPNAIRIGQLSPFSLMFFIFAVGEELGWRGYALPRLLARHRSIAASLILGALWAVWHWPMLMPGQVLAGGSILSHSPMLIAAAVLYTWLYQHSQGSVLPAILFHGAMNAWGIFLVGIDPVLLAWLSPILYILAAIIVVKFAGTDLGRRSETPVETAGAGQSVALE